LSWTAWALIIAALLFIGLRVAFIEYRRRYLRRMLPRWGATIKDSGDEQRMSIEDLPYLRRVLIEAHVGVEDYKLPNVQPVGWGYVNTSPLKLIDNLLVRDEKIANIVNQKFLEAIGAYRMRRNDTVNPIRWVVALWTLPKGVAKALGANQEAWPIRLLQVVYQLAVVGGIILQLWDRLLK